MQISGYPANTIKKNLLIYFVFLVLSLLLFAPVLHKNFASDDFDVLYRVVYQHGFFMKGFFRPLSDITLYLSYLIGGFNPLAFNLITVIIHAGCGFLVYYFCLQNKNIKTNNPELFAFFSAVLFVIYPFHNESVVWVVGRGSVVACFFGLLSLITIFSNLQALPKLLLSCLFYFIGMCAYESIIPLPAIVLILLYTKKHPVRNYLPVAACFAITLIVYTIIRYAVSGVIVGSYGVKIFEPSILNYFLKSLKVAGRLLLPPSRLPLVSIICFGIIAAVTVLISVVIIKRYQQQSASYLQLSLSLFISCVIPLLFGLNTRTYEGDRILYFSSVFLCIWIAYLADIFIGYKAIFIARIIISLYFLFFFYQGLLIWKKAGNITAGILSDVRKMKATDGNVYLLNLPEEYKGGQILRNSFKSALLINKIDTSGISVVNYINTESILMFLGNIKPVYKGQQIFIFPNVLIKGNTMMARIRTEKSANDSAFVLLKKMDKVYFWNKESFVQLEKPF